MSAIYMIAEIVMCYIIVPGGVLMGAIAVVVEVLEGYISVRGIFVAMGYISMIAEIFMRSIAVVVKVIMGFIYVALEVVVGRIGMRLVPMIFMIIICYTIHISFIAVIYTTPILMYIIYERSIPVRFIVMVGEVLMGIVGVLGKITMAIGMVGEVRVGGI